MAQEPPTAAGDKKRNKLGYHRTSIACSHCRRRKIRCIVSPEIQNRCINCIRLKKDCSFCPVDQQPVVDSQGNLAGQGTGSSTAHSQSSSPALAPGHPTGMPSRSMYGTGPVQDSVVLATPVIIPSNVGYASVAGEGLTIPIPTEQSFNVSPGSSLAWGSAEPSPVTLPGSMDMSYHWNPYGSESGSAEQTSAFGSELATQSAWMATTPDTTQLSNWGWNNGVTPTTQGRSVSFSNDLIGQPQQQFVSNTSNGLYDGASANLETPFSPSINLTSVPGHPPSQNGELGGNWESQQQELVHQQQQQHQGHQEMGFQQWGVSHNGGAPM